MVQNLAGWLDITNRKNKVEPLEEQNWAWDVKELSAALNHFFTNTQGNVDMVPKYASSEVQQQKCTPSYASTEKIGQAGALTRLIDSHKMEPEDIVTATVAVIPEVCAVVLRTMNQLPVTFGAVGGATKNDSILEKAIKYHQAS
ncbi:hypothetical protein T265_05256 [Opisthorchis viverrini]|uniref:Uncharacterized protein n=1 Tax=Opisthorchis viverrini TaxID=6198 RepID=A0A074ZPN7_OPIVI|nr:hypothetical protein T265_05256 [Opisthorchis viverrini]KER27767.1 hypothetical protein T265_05256 [Opisthorchis viverrini]